jgi:hypothetical protein
VNAENLLKLADWLDEWGERLEQEGQFDMYAYRSRGGEPRLNLEDADGEGGGRVEDDLKINEGCSTAACALGWATVVPGLEVVVGDFRWDALNEVWQLNWLDYCVRVFDLTGAGQLHGSAWEWLFGPSWWEWDNTPVGAARRVRELVRRGGVAPQSEDWVGLSERLKEGAGSGT